MYLNKIQLALSPQTYLNKLSLMYNGGGVIEEYVARLDGATKYWQLSEPIPVLENQDYKLTLYIQGERNNFEGVFEGTDLWFRFMDQDSVDFFRHYGQLSLDGVTSTALDWKGVNPRNGELNKLSIIRSEGITYSQINDGDIKIEGSSFNGAFEISSLGKYASNNFLGVIYGFEFEIDGVLTNSIPLTNKDQGATQLATVGNINAAMINFTGDEWEQLP